MCLFPRLIPNPLYKQDYFGIGKYRKPINPLLKLIKNYTDAYIYVPCGRCGECLMAKQNSFIQRIIMQCETSYMFFITLTYNNESLPQVVDSKGNKYDYPDSRDVQNMFKRIRFHNMIPRPFSYAAFSEYGGRNHRPHWHIMLFLDKSEEDYYTDVINLQSYLYDLFFKEWKRNYGSDKKPDYRPLFTFARRGPYSNYDCHYVNPSLTDNQELDVAFYVSKYLLKISAYEIDLMIKLRDSLEYKEYRDIRSMVRCKTLISKGLGLTDYSRKYIRYCIDDSLRRELNNPEFINPVSGAHYPLSKYFKDNLLTLQDKVAFAQNGEVYQGSKTWSIDYEKNVQYKHDRFKKRKKLIASRDSDFHDF